MKNILAVFSFAFIFAACGNMSDDSSAAFVTLLGEDTLAVEQFEKTEEGIQAQVVLRSPETSFSSYDLTLDDSGGISEMTRTNYSLEEGFSGEGEVVQTVRRMDDSLVVEVETDDGTRRGSVAYQEGLLPFIDMVHWPFEIVLNNAYKTGQDTVSQPLLTGSRISNFILARMDTDSMTIRHPFRGVMGVDVDNNGNLVHLDAGQTTRKLRVHRVPLLDIGAIGERFAAADLEGNSFGSLSGAASEEFSFNDTDFRVQYGVPEKRGRTIFGGIVPWGELWRTGANRATHFRTSSDLVFGDLEVPAGEYTLFTIPEEDGGTLIINEQTGQNGNSYDESRDLGRVPMEIREQDTVTEAFTITVEEDGDGGILKLIWDQTVFSVPFEIN